MEIRKDIKYNDNNYDTIQTRQILIWELKHNTALITKSIFLNNNIDNLLFKFLQTNISNFSAILCCVHKCNQWSLNFICSHFCKNKYWTKQYIGSGCGRVV
jgi:hypothetical protein